MSFYNAKGRTNNLEFQSDLNNKANRKWVEDLTFIVFPRVYPSLEFTRFS